MYAIKSASKWRKRKRKKKVFLFLAGGELEILRSFRFCRRSAQVQNIIRDMRMSARPVRLTLVNPWGLGLFFFFSFLHLFLAGRVLRMRWLVIYDRFELIFFLKNRSCGRKKKKFCLWFYTIVLRFGLENKITSGQRDRKMYRFEGFFDGLDKFLK